jgi:hypothetical protein
MMDAANAKRRARRPMILPVEAQLTTDGVQDFGSAARGGETKRSQDLR